MPSIYDKSTRELFEVFVNNFSPPFFEEPSAIERKPLSDGGYFTRPEILSWFSENYPKIKTATVNAHLIVMSTNAPSRVHHTLRPRGADDLLFQMDRSHFRLYVKGSDPPPIYKESRAEEKEEGFDDSEDTSNEAHEFAYERDLKNFLAKNLHVISSSLSLYQDGDISGIEFPVGGRYIDILALENEKDLVVIELKVSKGYDRTVGQILRYMAWIEKNLADSDQKVTGMIIARNISEDLRLAASRLKDVRLYEYELSISLKQINP